MCLAKPSYLEIKSYYQLVNKLGVVSLSKKFYSGNQLHVLYNYRASSKGRNIYSHMTAIYFVSACVCVLVCVSMYVVRGSITCTCCQH